jgi:hypothetical protein
LVVVTPGARNTHTCTHMHAHTHTHTHPDRGNADRQLHPPKRQVAEARRELDGFRHEGDGHVGEPVMLPRLQGGGQPQGRTSLANPTPMLGRAPSPRPPPRALALAAHPREGPATHLRGVGGGTGPQRQRHAPRPPRPPSLNPPPGGSGLQTGRPGPRTAAPLCRWTAAVYGGRHLT